MSQIPADPPELSSRLAPPSFGSASLSRGESSSPSSSRRHLTPAKSRDFRAREYYSGLPSCPKLVASSDSSDRAGGYSGHAPPKHIYVVPSTHKLVKMWEDVICPAVLKVLDELLNDEATCVDVVRIGFDEVTAPVVIWIGAIPSTSPQLGSSVVDACLSVLDHFAIQDVRVEVRETEVRRAADSSLMHPHDPENIAREHLQPFTTLIGTPITSGANPFMLGTGGVYMVDAHNPHIRLLLTAQHVVASADGDTILPDDHRALAPQISIFDGPSFSRHEEKLQQCISDFQISVDMYAKQMLRNTGDRLLRSTDAWRSCTNDLSVLMEAKEKMHEEWGSAGNRVLGQVYCHPPLAYGVGDQEYTEDWALVSVDTRKLGEGGPRGNLVNLLGHSIIKDRYSPPLGPLNDDRMLRIAGFVPKAEMLADEPIAVLKIGARTGRTWGVSEQFLQDPDHRGRGTIARVLALGPRNGPS